MLSKLNWNLVLLLSRFELQKTIKNLTLRPEGNSDLNSMNGVILT